MSDVEPSSAERIAAATPPTRDRYIDLIRVGSLFAVVVGHWLMAVVYVDGNTAETVNALVLLPSFQPLTWVLQVMPLFFLAGGFANLTGWRSVRRRGGGYADFMRARGRRLLQPMIVFIAVWTFISLLIEIAGEDGGLAAEATDRVGQPLWFVGTYLGVIACAPPTLWLHDRYGIRVPVAMALMAIGVDVLRFEFDSEAVGAVNFIFVWLLFQQLGFLYADGMLARRRLGATLVGGGLLVLVVLTTVGPYPTSMVSLPSDEVSNMAPPTVALLVLGLWLIGATMLLKRPLTRWLQRPQVWRGVVAANQLAMTIFLWHFTALIAVLTAGLLIGIDQPSVGTATWWWSRPLWIALLAGAMIPLLRIFARADRPRPTDVAVNGGSRCFATWLAVLGAGIAVIGVLAYAVVGFDGLLAGRSETLSALHVTPLTSGMILCCGVGLLYLSARASSARSDADPEADLVVQSHPAVPEGEEG